MNDDNRPNEVDPAGEVTAGKSPGRMLREAREAKGLSVQSVADALNLRAAVVEDLEQDRYERLPPATFVRGYLRGYAKVVDLKEYAVMGAYEQAQPHAAVAPAAGQSGRAEPSLQPRSGGGSRWWLWLLIPVLAIAGWYVYQNSRPIEPSAPVEAETVAPAEEAAPEPAVNEAPVTESAALEPAPVVTTPSTAAPLASSQPVVPEARPEPEPEQPVEAPPAAAAGALVVEVSGESWLQVRAGSETLHSGLVRGPTTLRFSGDEPFSLVIGDASQVRLQYDGEPVSLPARTPGRVLRLTVPRR